MYLTRVDKVKWYIHPDLLDLLEYHPSMSRLPEIFHARILCVAPPIRRSVAPSNGSVARKSTAGRVDSLSREGIVPTTPTVRSSTASKGSFRALESGAADGGVGWTRKVGRGTLSCSDAGRAGAVASEAYTSATVVACELNPDREKLSCGEYRIAVQVHVSLAAASGGGGVTATNNAGTAQVLVTSCPCECAK
jgi:hypothetical protein